MRISQGLFRILPGAADTQPEIDPLLAESPRVLIGGNRTWTVMTRSGVTFSDGTSFGAENVVATYQAIINPAVTSTELVRWQNLASVEMMGANQILFRLKDSSLNTTPVGTGPYQLSELRADQVVFEARDDYWGSKPNVTKIVIRYVADEHARAQQLRSGEGDGTMLSAQLSQAFADDVDFTVSSRTSADWHGITPPAAHPFAGDQAVRTALNFAMDRQGMVDGVLNGHGTPSSRLLAPFYGDADDASKGIPFDRARAEQLLDAAGAVTVPHEVSDGQLQRAAILRTFMHRPEVVLCDEVTSALDPISGASVMTALRQFAHPHGRGLLVVSHNIGLVEASVDRVLGMVEGRVVAGVPPTETASPREAPERTAAASSRVLGPTRPRC